MTIAGAFCRTATGGAFIRPDLGLALQILARFVEEVRELAVTVRDSNVRRFPCLPEIDCLW
jgi:hypothetical protein